MTTIAYRDGVIAGDTLVTWNGRRDGFRRKVWRFGEVLAGAAGSVSMAAAFYGWLRGGCQGDPPKLLDEDYRLEAIVVMPDGLIIEFNGETMWTKRAPYFALGSGSAFALGAMEAGASAIEAVVCAAKIDTDTGGKVQYLRRNERGK